jgi:hypothetical protein
VLWKINSARQRLLVSIRLNEALAKVSCHHSIERGLLVQNVVGRQAYGAAAAGHHPRR